MNFRHMLVAIAASTLCASAQAQLFRSYLASDGNDANACTLAAPCRLLPRALITVADGGEIWMLDSANFNTGQVEITKSVTILAIPGAVGSVVATGGGHALNINTAGVKVILRNLVITHLASSNHGVRFAQGAELNVAECQIANVGTSGISATAPGGKLVVRNTVVRNASSSGFEIGDSVVASLDRVQASGGSSGVMVSSGARVAVSNSVFSGNADGVFVLAATGVARVTVEGSTLTRNTNSGVMVIDGGGGMGEVTVTRSTITHNSSGFQVVGAGASVVLDGNVISENAAGIAFNGLPTVFTRGNNTLTLNGGADVAGGTLTALPAQ